MKSLFLMLGIFFAIFATPDISQLREQYHKAATSHEKAAQLYESLSEINENDKALLIGYKGATAMIMAKFAKGLKTKMTYFEEGRNLIDRAISVAPENTELRYIRLSVQENAPRILGYRKQITEDKQFILDHYQEVTDKEARKSIKSFVLQSASFSESEKQLF